jgi:hypothetical protein
VYVIQDGVHRAVAARNAGLTGVLATIYRDGQPPQVRVVELHRLYSTKPVIGRRDKGRDIVALTARLTTTLGRMNFEPVIVVRIATWAAARLTPLADVIVSDEAESEEGLP